MDGHVLASDAEFKSIRLGVDEAQILRRDWLREDKKSLLGL